MKCITEKAGATRTLISITIADVMGHFPKMITRSKKTREGPSRGQSRYPGSGNDG